MGVLVGVSARRGLFHVALLDSYLCLRNVCVYVRVACVKLPCPIHFYKHHKMRITYALEDLQMLVYTYIHVYALHIQNERVTVKP